MNLFKSVEARAIGFKAKHFNLFSEGKALKQLKNIHAGEKCVIVGNGPSLCAADLDVLEQKNIISFAFNRIFYIFSQTEWRPTYYISQDEKMLSGCADNVELISAKIKFIPAEIKWYYGIDIKGIQMFHIDNREVDGFPYFSEDIAKKIFNSKTVVYTAIQIAAYMGIREIYLIGVDHHFHTSVNSQGEIVIDPNAKDYFCNEYNTDKEKLYVPNTDKSTLTFVAAKKYCDTHGIKIYNATRGGKLEVFPRVDFDSVFS